MSWIDAVGPSLAAHVLWAYLLAALLLARAILRIPPLARRNAQRFSAIGAMAIVGLAMIVPNLLAIGNDIDPDLFPFNLAGIDFDDWIKRTSTHPGGPGDNLLRGRGEAVARAEGTSE